MRVVAALAWYREPTRFLTRCVASLAGVVDHVVAVDGAWRLFPDADTRSSRAERVALRAAARAAGVGLTIHTPGAVFESQVAKRAELMALASEVGDWILVIDGDEHVTHADQARVRVELAACRRDVADVGLTNVHPDGLALRGGLRRRLYRSGTTVESVHSGYCYAGRQLLTGEPALDLSSHLHLEHDYANRGPERNQQARDYLAARAAEREEVWV